MTIYYISGFQGNALGFFRDALGASKGREGREDRAKAPGAASCTSTRDRFVLYALCSSKVSFKEKTKTTNKQTNNSKA